MSVTNNDVQHQFVITLRARLMNSRPSRVSKKRGYCYDDCEGKKSNPRKSCCTNKKEREAGGDLQYIRRRTSSQIFEELRSAAFRRDSPAKKGADKQAPGLAAARSNQGSGGKGDRMMTESNKTRDGVRGIELY